MLMRIRLSSNRLVLKIIMVPFLSIMIACGVAAKQLAIIAIGIPVIFFVAYMMLFAGKKIEFDNENMYITNRDGEKTVDLKDVYYVKQYGYNSFGLGRIEYYSGKEENTVRFYPQLLTSSFSKFKAAVAKKNPKLRDAADSWFSI
jgi:hypothetical protein